MNYERDMAVDESALDVEWLRQPQLMLRYTRHTAEMKRQADQAKEAVDVEAADLDRRIRNKPRAFSLDKPTEAGVRNAIVLQPAYQRATAAYIDAKYEYDMAMAAVRAMDQRKTALENLVRLHGMAYFAGPSVPRDLSKEWETKQHQKKANTAVAKFTRSRAK